MDPHTYPGRPWPLSTLTIRHTDLYLRKSFQLLQSYLAPNAVIFLGDLFDGGREWTTAPSASSETKSPDKRWNKYGEKFWFREYGRFGRIFFDPWLRGGQRGRRLISSLPGNHDLGFGVGIRLPVRSRFNAYFGEGNRIDVIGNHTFVSLDTISLSASGQPDPATGSQGSGTTDERARKIWDPAEIFLSNVKTEKARMVNRELRLQAGLPEYEPQDHTVIDISDHHPQELSPVSSPNMSFPTILLTHVPLYRARGTPCGPLRERYPPSQSAGESDEALVKDDRNALPVGAGVQYQTVLTPTISDEILEKVGQVENVFSGDDHDYCEVIHRGYTSRNGGIREITVKAMSWAAGIRKPGFLMLSLWNPVDAEGNPIVIRGNSKSSRTTETHLCLLPDQLSIFMRYGILFGFTVFTLLVQALITVCSSSPAPKDRNGAILPVFEPEEYSNQQESMTASARSWAAPQPRNPGSNSPTGPFTNGLAARWSTGRTRSASPFDEYGLPVQQESATTAGDPRQLPRDEGMYGKKEWKEVVLDDRPGRSPGGTLSGVLQEWSRGLVQVGLVSFCWYIWLVWKT